ncbi:MAG: response regulator [Deltaproteobacteria bacterium]|nr:response regulator [Deltaproteobacteria bacterium]MBW2220053.1 response regulator [Deltaproteobacteria bacterium]
MKVKYFSDTDTAHVEFTDKVKKATPEKIPTGNEKILFVDDDEAIVKVVRRMLERLGYQVETKGSASEALALFQSKPDHFDLILTDMTMPHMTGFNLFEKIVKIRPGLPVIVCTGHSAIIDEEKAKKLGIAAFVMKPISIQEIAETIRKVLNR